MDRYHDIVWFEVRRHEIRVQVRHDEDKRWLEIEYQFTGEQMAHITSEWLNDWFVSVTYISDSNDSAGRGEKGDEVE